MATIVTRSGKGSPLTNTEVDSNFSNLNSELGGIESNATADQTGAEIKAAYEAETNAFTDAQFTKLAGIEASATSDQTAAEIRALVEGASDSNVFTDADHTKLNAIEAGANVTDTANVVAALTAGTNIAIASNGTISSTDTNTTYSVGDGGLSQINFTSADHTKLNGIATNANNYSFPYTVSKNEGGNTVVQRAADGYLHANYFNGTGTFATSGASSGMGNFTGNNGSDTYGRSYNAAAARTLLNVANGATADQTAAQILTAIKTVDGAGSGLDADLLDGINSDGFVKTTGTQTISGVKTFTGTNVIFDTAVNSWKYLRLQSSGSTKWDIATNEADTSGALQFRPVGGSSNRGYVTTSGYFVSDNQGTLWGASNDGAGSGLDSDLLDGVQGSSYLRSDTSDTFTGTLTVAGTVNAVSLQEDYDAASGTTPTLDADNAGYFSLTTSGNTTFTFGAVTSGRSVGFILALTAGGTHTLTWPSTVDWADGAAPDAPASGASNLYVFVTRDGGTNWIGVLSAAAYA